MHARVRKIGRALSRAQPLARRATGLSHAPRHGLARWWILLGPRQPPPEPKARGPLARDERLARVEAVLFLAREPLTTRKIGQLAGLADGTAARTSVRQLNRLYNAGGSPFRAEELAGGFQLLTRPVFGPWLRRLLHTPVETRLSAPALETLAVVAYRQPVLRADIEAIRGVQCGDILRQLMDRDLVRIVSRADDLGRPLLYGTTKRFLQIFGLRHLDELPQAESLRRRSPSAEPSPPAEPSPSAETCPPAETSQKSDLPAGAHAALPGVPMQTLENRAI